MSRRSTSARDGSVWPNGHLVLSALLWHDLRRMDGSMSWASRTMLRAAAGAALVLGADPRSANAMVFAVAPPARTVVATTSARSEAPVDSELPPLSVEVQVDMGPDAAAAAQEMAARAKAVLVEHLMSEGFTIDGAAHEVVTISLRHFDVEERHGYRARIELSMPDGSPPRVIDAGCACAGLAFLDALRIALPKDVRVYAGAHRTQTRAQAARAAADAQPATPPPGPAVPLRYEMGAFAKIGIALTVVGVGMVTGGAVMWKLGVDRGEPPSDRGGLGQGGAVLLGSGVVYVAGGVSMVIVDVVLDRKWRRSVQPVAKVDWHGGIFGVTGRF